MSITELLKKWLEFSEDVKANDAAGNDWLDDLRDQTKLVINNMEANNGRT